MRTILLVIAGFSLAACANEVDPLAVSAAAGKPELYNATPDGGHIANADGVYADEAAEIAAAHCLKTDRDVRITGVTAQRRSLIFTCVTP